MTIKQNLLMTRINSAIHPNELPSKLLLAEHREIKRIPNAILKGHFNLEGIPSKFTLGKGHVKFFYDKLYYLYRRYERIYLECCRRGFKVTWYGQAFLDVSGKHPSLWNNWHETIEARREVKARIESKGFSLLTCKEAVNEGKLFKKVGFS